MAGQEPQLPETPANPIQPTTPQALARPKLLIGEGRDEFMFFRALLAELGMTDVQVEEYGGKTRLRRYLQVLPLRPGFTELRSLGITRDADSGASAAFQSVVDALRTFKLPSPKRQMKAAPGPPRTSVLIFPGGRKRKGMLEDLCLAAAESDKAMLCVEEFLRCVRRRAKRKPKSASKARVQAWLASQERSDLQLGLAAQQNIWDWSNSAFDELKEFVRGL